MSLDPCYWTEDSDGNYETTCQEAFTFSNDGPKENKFAYCPYCGLVLITKPFKWDDDEETDDDAQDQARERGIDARIEEELDHGRQ